VNVAERVQASIRAVNTVEREPIVAGPFTLYRNRASDHPYLNYAVPNAGVRAWDGIDRLRAAFTERGLRPRLEFVAERAPGLEEALAADGFELEGRYPVLTLPAEDLREVPAPEGVVIARVLPGGDVRALLRTAAEAFGGGEPTDAEVAGYAGRGHLARVHGEPAGAAFHSAIAEGVSELGGIGVRERFRRRGIAAALTGAAAAAAVADGAELCFLTPGDEGAERVYARGGGFRSG
jgi:ribosomal protein S18 acetylase RimI-like enzyme